MQTYRGDVPSFFLLQDHSIYLEVIKAFNNVNEDIQKIKFSFGDHKGIIVLDDKKTKSPNLRKLLQKNTKIFYDAVWQCYMLSQRFGIVLEKLECIKALSRLVFPPNITGLNQLYEFMSEQGLIVERGFENLSHVHHTIHYQILQNSLQKQAKDINTLTELAVFLKCNGYNVENIMNHGFKR